LELFIQGKAVDGMDIDRYYNFDWVNPSEAPDDKAVQTASLQLRKEMEGLVASPINDPSVTPALLTGRAAAVFFHEVFGHRAEGHRQKDVNEGQTFTKKVGEQILPSFLTVIDDTTRRKVNDQELLGFYEFDDEGVPAQRVTLVDHGVLKNFEMSRSPIDGFPKSNGHGRRQLGATPVSRQGNLIVESNKMVTNAQLREKLIEVIKQQGKPYGLLIDDIAGGFTLTGRGQPQAFQVEPLVVYKVFADGKPDELVRGVDIVGTPLASLAKIIATGDTPEVFNGYCGAESGSVPVSAVSPAILTTELEVQKKPAATDRPPILPAPAHDAVKTGGLQ
jgi:TldD protein